MRHLLVAFVLCVAGSARGDDGLRSGFEVHGPGELRGLVTAVSGTPLGKVEVHLTSASGEASVVTDHDGRFRLDVAGDAFVYVHGTAHVSATMAVPTTSGGQEIIELHDMVPPSVMPVPTSSTRAIPGYTAKAIDADAWTKAWLLLEVADDGTVARIKLVNDPGYDLAGIAIRAAFALTFEPARDRTNHPVRAWMLWAYEWPARTWMAEHDAPLVRLPSEVDEVPCRGSGPTHTLYRDCSPPDLARALARPWLGRAKP